MDYPNAIRNVVLDGHSLTLEQLVAVARFDAKVSLAPKAIEAMSLSRALAERISDEKRAAYGISTGFGEFAKIAIPEEMSSTLSTNLILSHSVATGEPYSVEQSRAMLLLRANTLCAGLSGVRPLLVQTLVDMLNKGVTPVVPQKGSLGASGDLAPLSHIGLVLLGKGEAWYQGEKLPGEEAMRRAGIPVLDRFVSKEGLGMTNGTCAMTGVGALCLYDAMEVARMADVIGALSFTALCGQRATFQDRMHIARGQLGQILVARNLRLLTEDSEILDNAEGERIQDAYALRCIPQVHGAVRDAMHYIRTKVEIELNAVTDNPLLFLEDEAVISCGNFHGEPMALAFDFLGIALSELGTMSERRIERMVNANLSNGLPMFLAPEGGVNSGYMIVQYSAASMASENKVLAHPACVDSIPSSANQEDFVSMGTTSARKCTWILENTRSVLAYELLTACQAIDIRRKMNTHGQGISAACEAVYQRVRRDIPFCLKDREMRVDIEKIEHIIRSGELQPLIEKACPALKENQWPGGKYAIIIGNEG